MGPGRSRAGTSEYLLITAVILILTLGGLTVFGEDLQRLLSPTEAGTRPAPTVYSAAPELPASAADAPP